MNIGWTIALFILIVLIWLTLDYTLGKRKHISSLSRKEYPLRLSQIEMFTHGKALFSAYFRELKDAKHHIHVLFYIVKDDAISAEFFSILEEKAMAGVEVRLLLDWLGSKSVKRKTIQKLRNAGVKFSFSHKPRPPFFFYSLQTRNHRKITIIDGRIGFLGGYNVGKEYIDGDPKLSPWRDYHLKITGEAVEDLQREFLLDWRIWAQVDLFNDEIYFPKLEKGPFLHQIIPSQGYDLVETYSSLINKAKKTLTIGTPYFIPSDKMMSDLIRALKRGVQVTIIVPSVADHILVQEGSFRYLRSLLREGATVYQYMKGFYHAKIVLADDLICDIGTANFDKRSLFLNQEINCYLYDARFIQSVKEILSLDIKDSQRLTLSHLNAPNLFRTIKEWAARAASPFL